MPCECARGRTRTEQKAIYLGGGGLGWMRSDPTRERKVFMWREIALPGIGNWRRCADLRSAGKKRNFPDSDLPKIVQTVLLAAVLNTPTLGGGLRLHGGASRR